MTDLVTRLRSSGADLSALRQPLVAGEPWQLSDSYGTEPEATWGPRELLAHVEEMLTYWIDELRRVQAGDGTAAVPFGRIASDASRLRRIDEARQHDVGRLLDDIRIGLDDAVSFADGLDDDDRTRLGTHPTRGELTIEASIERFLVTHLEDHVVQLREILDRNPGAQGG
ncbi:MAG TPA: hypothetical protein VGO64_10675 [Candidatus Limnocylindrales bacterium]|nr:hypothetical protein [Candidatus Limnocylindrales bacterium]